MYKILKKILINYDYLKLNENLKHPSEQGSNKFYYVFKLETLKLKMHKFLTFPATNLDNHILNLKDIITFTNNKLPLSLDYLILYYYDDISKYQKMTKINDMIQKKDKMCIFDKCLKIDFNTGNFYHNKCEIFNETSLGCKYCKVCGNNTESLYSFFGFNIKCDCIRL